MASSKRYLLHVVSAFDRKLGMGYRGKIPWPSLKTDIDFIHRITTETTGVGARNAVMMGRRTWESIRDEEHPWAKSFVVVLSSQSPAAVAAVAPGADLVCSSLNGALDTLQSPPLCDEIESVYVLGGRRMYQETMDHPQCGRLYTTEIDGEFPADTFHPPIDHTIFIPVQCDDVPQGDFTENGVKYRFKVYERQNRT